MRRNEYLPEGLGPLFPENHPLSVLRQAMDDQTVLEGMAIRCDGQRDLTVRFGGYEGTIPRQDVVHPAISGAERDIAILSRVGKPTCFTITAITVDGGGKPRLTLSRRAAQEQAIAWLLEHSELGSVLPVRVSHLEKFGAFVDLGCGVTSLVPVENISVARIPHPAVRLRVGQDILVTVTGIDSTACRFYLSHKELLGTWLENAAAFSPGDAVPGIVRGVRDYGIFIELAPNLSGLADWRGDVEPGDKVSVYIKSIRPECRKIKLQIIQNLGPAREPGALKYFITDGVVRDWSY
ncbi:MAG: S1 RNA-binding domain-containing protein [Oscillospiraceae bacterium]|nr:S1 RNA-binding domain-containing protein [Oscillospiraceae bacterium]